MKDPHTRDSGTPFHVHRPAQWTAPVVFASPHSGRDYPQSLIDASRLGPVDLRRSEDAFIDELYAAAPEFGAPLLVANFPRVYVDPNREQFELDPDMFEDALPSYVNTTSPRIAAGLGTMAKVVTSGEEVYRDKIRFEDAKKIIAATYVPYHKALQGLLNEARNLFGGCLLVDCHSMPSIGGPMDKDPGFTRVDFILGDRHGKSCQRGIVDTVEQILQSMDYKVTRNAPYAGGFTTYHYGQPDAGCHALQIEINRALYLDERTISRSEGFEPLRQSLRPLIEILSILDPKTLAAP